MSATAVTRYVGAAALTIPSHPIKIIDTLSILNTVYSIFYSRIKLKLEECK
jgi:hypothetical protein